jgi:integrase
MIFLGFYAFLRWSDIARKKFRHISFYPTHAIIRLRKRKNDQYGKGSNIWVSRLPQIHCPVKLLERVLASQIKSYNRLSTGS